MFLKTLPWTNKQRSFLPVPTKDVDEPEVESRVPIHGGRSSMFWYATALSAAATGIALLAGAVGFYAGLQTIGPLDIEGLLAPAGTVSTHMIWNSTFSHLPSEKTFEAWQSLFPDGLGLVQHPTLAPETSALAVYHQMHCLHIIHHGYSEAVGAIASRDHPGILSVHAEHCFDYLRQAIQCAADTSLEPVDPRLYGVQTAIPKKCRDLTKVSEWAAKWKTTMASRDLQQRFTFIRELEKGVY